MRTSPMMASSACTSGSLKELILSTNAGGNVDCIPKMIPTFFTAAPLERSLLGQRQGPRTNAERGVEQPNSKAFSLVPRLYSRYILAMGCHHGQSWKL